MQGKFAHLKAKYLWTGLILLLAGCGAAGGPQSILPSVGDYASSDGFRGSFSSSSLGGRPSLQSHTRRDPNSGPRGTVQGKVFVRSGKGEPQPLEGAEVIVQVPYHPDDAMFFQSKETKDAPTPTPLPPQQWYAAKTDKDGNYTVKSVPAGQYPVSASKVGYSLDEKFAEVGFGQTVTRDFTLRLQSGTTSGTVVDADTGKPIERATVQVIVPVPLDASARSFAFPHPDRTPQTQTDEKGHFSLPVPQGQQTLVAFKDDYEAQQSKVKLSVGGSATVDFKLRAKNMLTVQTTTEKRQYAVGEKVKMTLALTNTGKRAVTLNFRSGQTFDFIVKRGRKEVWRWSHDMAFTLALQNVTLTPDETKRFEAVWDQKDNNGAAVGDGRYAVSGVVTAMPPLQSEAALLTIGNPK